MSKITPMIQQYLAIKDSHQDAILFYRMGDFYEMFFEDAVLAARELEITLTSRDKQAEDPIPMCGVPHHAANAYIARLLEKGYKVALCEQVEDPHEAKGLMRREVVRLVTPGTVLDSLDSKKSNYLAAVCWAGEKWGLAYLDVSTADFRMTEMQGFPWLVEELGRVEPRELLVPENGEFEVSWWRERLGQCSVQIMESRSFEFTRAQKKLVAQFQVHSLEGFGVKNLTLAVSAAGAILDYVQQTQRQNADHIRRVTPYCRSDYMIIDEVTARHLELFRSWHDGGRKGTLVELLDRTVTAMGGRLLRVWMNYPLIQPESVSARQNAVACFREHEAVRMQVRHELERVYDIERLNSRVAMGSATPRDFAALRTSLQSLPRLRYLLDNLEDPTLAELTARLDPLEDLASLLEEAISDNPPPTLADGGVIRLGYNEELDQLLSLSRDTKKWIAQLEAEERHKTGISSLRVGYNKVFGYYLEVSKANLVLVPDRYIRKQTLVNAERYITEKLKEYESQVLSADERRIRLEEELFTSLRAMVADDYGARIQTIAAVIAEVDVFAALAEVANQRNYCRPHVDEGTEIHITEGRHPVVEAALPPRSFVPNDVHLDDLGQQIIIITGPNMAGKSTVLRQVALIVIMAQMGVPVPASFAHLGVIDRIFTRVGATDELTRGRSTFMVEMQETAHILHQATKRSLVVLDEIGRGTSTFDGLSIAWAVAEFLHDWQGKGIKTLFATHYHELTNLVATCARVKNMNVAVKEWGDKIIFLRKLVEGGTNRSYGIQVARLAGLPAEVVERAKHVLHHLQQETMEVEGLPRLARSSAGKSGEHLQLSLFQQADQRVRRRLEKLELEHLTPIEALNELANLLEIIRK